MSKDIQTETDPGTDHEPDTEELLRYAGFLFALIAYIPVAMWLQFPYSEHSDTSQILGRLIVTIAGLMSIFRFSVIFLRQLCDELRKLLR